MLQLLRSGFAGRARRHLHGVLRRPLALWAGRRWDWSRQTPAELALAEQLAGRFLYRRVGHDQRYLRLKPGGTIAEGAAGLERHWCVRTRGGVPALVILGDSGPTMFLRRDADGVWRGRWERYERMPVELIPSYLWPIKDADPAWFGGRRPVFVCAPAGRMTGYGHYAARVLHGLRPAGVPFCLNGLYTDPADVDDGLRGLVCRPRPDDWQVLVSPPHVLGDYDPTRRSIVLTMWESEALLPEWVRELNRAALVLVPCRWNRDCFRRAGVTTRIEVVPLGHDPAIFTATDHYPSTCTFGFAASLAGGGVRKNVEGLVRAFARAFPRETDVRLELKLTPRCPFPDRVGDARVRVVKAYLSDQELSDWYGTLTAFVNPSRAEAWGLHLLEAMATGRPVISTAYSGVTEYFDEAVGYAVGYRVTESNCPPYHGRWAEPDPASLAACLRQVYHDRAEAARRGRAAAGRATRFTWERMSDRIVGLLREVGAAGL